MNRRRAFVLCLLVGLVCVLAPAMAAETEQEADVRESGPAELYEGEPGPPELAPSEKTFTEWIEDVKHPADWFEWGGDLRLRGVYTENVLTLLNEMNDVSHFFRIRGRVWGRADLAEALDIEEQLSVYARITTEPRYFAQRGLLGGTVPTWDEVVLDNLYVDWARIGGAPVSLRVGRQDMVYGRGFVILDGTPLDGSRTIYQDAIKATVHLDEWDSNLDVFYINNKAFQKRIRPLNETESPTSAFDTTVFGTYLVNKHFAPHELNAYYIYKDEDVQTNPSLRNRIVHTVGGLAQGKLEGNWDYYAEAAGQWGRQGTATRKAFGFSGDLGHTWPDAKWQPRVHAGFEYLSGDDPSTSAFEGWDPVLARWPHWSELYVYTLAPETGLPGQYTNLQRYTLGTSVHPGENSCVDLDYSYVRANENFNVPTMPIFDTGYTRGHLLMARLSHTFNKYISGHLWAEYFHPESFYIDDTDEALFLRWQLMFKF